jgi:meso-butanediol dehydrogenase/(S,S)-butanediol dehydrogenase/diacetyl reductase
MHRFTNKAVVVTGGSRGIGRAIAARFAREGARVCIAANADRVDDAAAELRGEGLDVIGWRVDVTVRAEVAALYDHVDHALVRVRP